MNKPWKSRPSMQAGPSDRQRAVSDKPALPSLMPVAPVDAFKRPFGSSAELPIQTTTQQVACCQDLCTACRPIEHFVAWPC